MNSTVVFFGPANAGKSTLIGYLKAQTIGNLAFQRQISEIECEHWYEPKQKYAYLLDRSMGERDRFKDKGANEKRGRSIYMHTEEVSIGDHEITVIDTPGFEHGERERLKGMFYGEFGFFVIELGKIALGKDLLDICTLQEFVTPLFVWKKLRPHQAPVVIISKMDPLFREEDFKYAVERIRYLLGARSIEAIPTSVDVGNEIGHNIVAKSDKLSWYQGPTVDEKLRSVYSNRVTVDIKEPLFFCLTKRSLGAGSRPVWKGKVLSGGVAKDETVQVAPIKHKRSRIPCCTATVSDIRSVNTDLAERACRGDMVEIQLKGFRDPGGRRLKDREVSPTKTTCFVGERQKLASGNVLVMSIDRDLSPHYRLGGDIVIVWFGRLISGRIIRVHVDGSSFNLTLLLPGTLVSVPVGPDKKPQYRDYWLRRKSKKRYDLVSSRLMEVGHFQSLRFEDTWIGDHADRIMELYPTGCKFEKGTLTVADVGVLFRIIGYLKRASNRCYGERMTTDLKVGIETH